MLLKEHIEIAHLCANLMINQNEPCESMCNLLCFVQHKRELSKIIKKYLNIKHDPSLASPEDSATQRCLPSAKLAN